ncbi:MAG TPA: HPr family phosphocarrier protein [Chloroflexota bacterium]
MADATSAELEVQNEHGLHARPAALFVQRSARFRSAITLRNLTRDGKEVNAKSIMDVLTAGVEKGSRIQIFATGSDADEAVESLTELIRMGLGDT